MMQNKTSIQFISAWHPVSPVGLLDKPDHLTGGRWQPRVGTGGSGGGQGIELGQDLTPEAWTGWVRPPILHKRFSGALPAPPESNFVWCFAPVKTDSGECLADFSQKKRA